MKFGRTIHARFQRKQKRLERLFGPRFWFAWYPVRLKDGRIAFLERVIRTLPIVIQYGHHFETKARPTYEALS